LRYGYVNRGGGATQLTHEILYKGEDADDIARQIDSDNDKLLEYMRTGNTKGEECFYFNGLMVRKAFIAAARLTEADY
jgi:hypothetical protein